MHLVEVKPSQLEESWLKSQDPKVRGMIMQYRCVACLELVTYEGQDPYHRGVFADVEGRPFKDYYCGRCVAAGKPPII